MMEFMDTLSANTGATANSTLPTTRSSKIPDEIVRRKFFLIANTISCARLAGALTGEPDFAGESGCLCISQGPREEKARCGAAYAPPDTRFFML